MGRRLLNSQQASRVVRRHAAALFCASLLALYVYLFVMSPAPPPSCPFRCDSGAGGRPTKSGGGQPRPGSSARSALFDNRSLTAEQCAAAFPGLTHEIDRAVAGGPFTLEKRGALGPLLARIRDGKLTILRAARRSDLSRDMLAHRTATLHQIHAALLTAPGDGEDEIPRDTVFAFSHHDNPSPGTFSYCRPVADLAAPGQQQSGAGGDGGLLSPAPYFPIPHFGHWAWPLPFVGSLGEAARAITAIEEELGLYDDDDDDDDDAYNSRGRGAGHDGGKDQSASSPPPTSPYVSRWWAAKEPRAVWRGTPHFNSPSTTSAGGLRQELLRTVAAAGARHRAEEAEREAGLEQQRRRQHHRRDDGKNPPQQQADAAGPGTPAPLQNPLGDDPDAYTSHGGGAGSSSSGGASDRDSTNPPWADVAALAWTQGGRNASNAVRIADFCRRRYIVYTEGVTYSGRLAYHQQCGSVVLTPPLAWLQPTTHLVRPVFSHALAPRAASSSPSPSAAGTEREGSSRGGNSREEEEATQPAAAVSSSSSPYRPPWIEAAWGAGYAPDEANMVFVAPDWSDLEATVLWLEEHPQVAEGIARRQRELFHGRGYLSPAAEMCYWRAALRGWAKTVRYEGQGFEEMEGIPFEDFVLSEVHR